MKKIVSIILILLFVMVNITYADGLKPSDLTGNWISPYGEKLIFELPDKVTISLKNKSTYSGTYLIVTAADLKLILWKSAIGLDMILDVAQIEGSLYVTNNYDLFVSKGKSEVRFSKVTSSPSTDIDIDYTRVDNWTCNEHIHKKFKLTHNEEKYNCTYYACGDYGWELRVPYNIKFFNYKDSNTPVIANTRFVVSPDSKNIQQIIEYKTASGIYDVEMKFSVININSHPQEGLYFFKAIGRNDAVLFKDQYMYIEISSPYYYEAMCFKDVSGTNVKGD